MIETQDLGRRLVAGLRELVLGSRNLPSGIDIKII
jgi:hypothetical protein